MPAIVTHVWDDYIVNLSVFDHNGRQWPVQQVMLVQEGGEVAAAVDQRHCEWMPYQQQVAATAKPETAAVESELLAAVNVLVARVDGLTETADSAMLELLELKGRVDICENPCRCTEREAQLLTLDAPDTQYGSVPEEIKPFREE
jgi:hypothetical protein